MLLTEPKQGVVAKLMSARSELREAWNLSANQGNESCNPTPDMRVRPSQSTNCGFPDVANSPADRDELSGTSDSRYNSAVAFGIN
jgi:hypothetical protein